MQQRFLTMMATLGVAGIFITLMIVWLLGLTAGFSVFLGFMIVLIPNAFFGFYYFHETRASRAKIIVNRFYRAEVLKILSTALLVALCVRWVSVNVLWFLLGFLGMQLSAWFTPLFFRGPIWRML